MRHQRWVFLFLLCFVLFLAFISCSPCPLVFDSRLLCACVCVLLSWTWPSSSCLLSRQKRSRCVGVGQCWMLLGCWVLCGCWVLGVGSLVPDHHTIADTNPVRVACMCVPHTQVAHLERLDLSHNTIKVLPPEIGVLVTLTTFTASHNKLRTIPDQVFLLTRLQSLDLSCNRIAVCTTHPTHACKHSCCVGQAGTGACCSQSERHLCSVQCALYHRVVAGCDSCFMPRFSACVCVCVCGRLTHT